MVTSLGSSPEPMGAGSTYFRVVRSECVIPVGDAVDFGPLTSLLLDLGTDVEVEGEDEKIGNNIEDSHSQEDLRIVKRDLFRYLHHPKHDNKVGTVFWSNTVCRATPWGTYTAGLRAFMMGDRYLWRRKLREFDEGGATRT